VAVDFKAEDVTELTVRNVNDARLSLTQTYDLDIDKLEVAL
jgi:hypothetical protein